MARNNNKMAKMEHYEENEYEDRTLTAKLLNRDRIVQAVIDFVIIGIVTGLLAVVYFLLEPRILYFTCNDTDIVYPMKPDTVTMLTVFLYGTLGPLAFVIVVELLNSKLINIGGNKATSRAYPDSSTRRRNFFICVFHAISLFLLGMCTTLLLTETGK
jgi:hypothetical protein